MSIAPLRAVGAAIGATAVLAVAGPASAGEVTFDPAVSLLYGYTDNVLFLDDNAAGFDGSTSLARLGLSLPVTRHFRNGELTFTYDVGYTQYQDFEELDDDDHSLSLDLERQASRKTQVLFETTYQRSQGRLGIGSVDGAFFLGPRLRQDTLWADVGVRHDINQRWQWEGHVGGFNYDLEGIAGFDNQADQVLVEERDGYYVATNVSKQVSQKTRVLGEYEYRRTDLALSGDEDLQRAAAVFDRQVGRRGGVVVRLGGFHRSRSDVSGGDDSGIDAAVNIRFNDDLEAGPVRFGFNVGVEPDTGGDLGGSALNTFAGVFATGANENPWTWVLAAQWARRDPFEDNVIPEVTTTALSGTLERRVAKLIGFRVKTAWVDQSTDNALAYEGAYYTADAGLVWYPLGRSRIAQPPESRN